MLRGSDSSRSPRSRRGRRARAGAARRRAREVVDRVSPDRRDHARADGAQRREDRARSTRRRPDPGGRPRSSIPAAVMCRRGAGLPGHSVTDTDLVVIAPSSRASPCRATSAPCPYVPDAVTIGFGSSSDPSVHLRSPRRTGVSRPISALVTPVRCRGGASDVEAELAVAVVLLQGAHLGLAGGTTRRSRRTRRGRRRRW